MATTNSNKSVDMPDNTDFTEEELAQLSDEEREALKAEEDESAAEGKVEDEPEAKKEDEPEIKEDEPEVKEEDESDETPDEPEVKETEEPEAEEKADDAPKLEEPTSVVDANSDTFIPQLDETGVENYDEQVEALSKKYEDGDISLAEFTKQTGTLAALNATAEANRINNERMAEQRWEADKDAFFEVNPAFAESNDPDLYDALDAKLRRMATNGELDGMSGPKALATAAREVVKARGLRSVPGKELSGENKDTRPRPKKSDAEPPAGLAQVPAAGDNETTQGKFAKLDQLEGEALEDAVAALSEADRIAYDKML